MIINDKRALAYIVTIDEIRPIPNYDRVEHARVNGWWVIVRKGELKVGDKAIYFEIDSKVPKSDERFKFLENRHYKIKTLRMCKVFSQGLIMPLSEFPEYKNEEIGTDLTDKIGILYAEEEDNKRKSDGVDPNARLNSIKARHKKLFKNKFVRWLMKYKLGRKIICALFGRKKDKPRSFPTKFEFIHKTDEERCENMPWVLGYKNPLIVTEKLDGTSSTYILDKMGTRRKPKYEFYVLSRNVRQMTPDQKCFHESNIYWENAIKYHIEDNLKDFIENNGLTYACMQGESVGSVQGNPLKLKENDLYIFNLIRSDIGRLPSDVAKGIVESYGMKFVPILDTNFYMPNDMEEFKKMATAKSAVNPAVMREGIVLRDPTTGLSFKNVSREYLEKHNG